MCISILDEEPVLSNTGTMTPDMQNNNVIEFDKVNFSYGRERVLHDVREGIVSRNRAQEVYGIVIDEKMEIDEAATQLLRA